MALYSLHGCTIVGYSDARASRSVKLLMRSIKPSTAWHGEVAIFSSGCKVDYLAHPGVLKKKDMAFLAALYVFLLRQTSLLTLTYLNVSPLGSCQGSAKPSIAVYHPLLSSALVYIHDLRF